jgi:hypothetical protein
MADKSDKPKALQKDPVIHFLDIFTINGGTPIKFPASSQTQDVTGTVDNTVSKMAYGTPNHGNPRTIPIDKTVETHTWSFTLTNDDAPAGVTPFSVTIYVWTTGVKGQAVEVDRT